MALKSNALTSVANVKAYLSPWIAGTTYDTLIEMLIDGVSQLIEKECGSRVFNVTDDDVVELLDGDWDGTGRCKLFPKRYPIVSITSIEYKTGSLDNPTWTAFNASDYTYDEEAGIIYFTASLSSIKPNRQNIRLTYKGGYAAADLPSDLQMCCLKMVAKEFDKRRSQGATSESVGGGNVSWNEDIDPSAKAIFRKYRRF